MNLMRWPGHGSSLIGVKLHKKHSCLTIFRTKQSFPTVHVDVQKCCSIYNFITVLSKSACFAGFISSLEPPSEQQLVPSTSNDDDFAV